MRTVLLESRKLVSGDSVWSAEFSFDGSAFVTTHKNFTAEVFDAITGELRARFDGVRHAILSPNALHAVTVGDGRAHLWSLSPQRLLKAFGTDKFESEPTFSTDGSLLLLRAEEPFAVVYDGLTGQRVSTLRGHEDWIFAAEFSPDSSKAITIGMDDTVRLWETASGRVLNVLHVDAKCGSFSPDSRLILTVSRNEGRVWDSESGQNISSFSEESVTGLLFGSFSPDCQRVVTVSEHEVFIWDAGTGERLAKIQTGYWDEMQPCVARFSPDGRWVLCAYEYGGGPTLWCVDRDGARDSHLGDKTCLAAFFDRMGTSVTIVGTDAQTYPMCSTPYPQSGLWLERFRIDP